MEALIKNEVWGDRIGAIALDVFDGLRRSDTAGETVAEVVYETACGMLTRNTDSYLQISTSAALGTGYRVTAAFLLDKFRDDLAATAHKRLFGVHTDDP